MFEFSHTIAIGIYIIRALYDKESKYYKLFWVINVHSGRFWGRAYKFGHRPLSDCELLRFLYSCQTEHAY